MLKNVVDQLSLFVDRSASIDVMTAVKVMDSYGDVVKIALPAVEQRVDSKTWHEFIAYSMGYKDEWSKWTVKSAYHKEIRRKDQFRGAQYAWWFRRNVDAERLKQYARVSLFEESRNLALMEFMNKSGDAMEIARRMVRSKKKYELSARKEVFSLYVETCSQAMDDKDFGVEFGVSEMVAGLRDGDLRERLLTMWRVANSKDENLKKEFDAQLVSLGNEFGPWSAKLANGAWGPYNRFYVRKVLIEIISGCWDEEANELEPEDKRVFDEICVPVFEDYVFDIHTRRGKTWLMSEFVDIKPNKRLPGRIDMRWSGMLRGTYWRELAYRQVKDPRLLLWHEVKMDEELWKKIMSIDFWFYEQLYKDLGIDRYGKMIVQRC